MIRIGFGCDIHPFDKSRKLFLGGIFFPAMPGLKGHSDADVVLHAVCDALLGAAGLGDIGEHFPDTDASYKGKESGYFLDQVVRKINNIGYVVNNIDIMILAEKPKISPIKDKMKSFIAEKCFVANENVNVKASTTEKLGFIGREEGIVAYAVATIKKAEDSNGEY